VETETQGHNPVDGSWIMDHGSTQSLNYSKYVRARGGPRVLCCFEGMATWAQAPVPSWRTIPTPCDLPFLNIKM